MIFAWEQFHTDDWNAGEDISLKLNMSELKLLRRVEDW
jgi:hypothetical protein